MSTEQVRINMQERTMIHIPTTANRLEKLKRLAKTRCKESGLPLHQVQDALAQEHGYVHWKHVTVCAAATRQTPKVPAGDAAPSESRWMREFGHLLNEAERALFPSMTRAEQDLVLLDLAKRTPEGAARFKPLSVSVAIPSRGATKP